MAAMEEDKLVASLTQEGPQFEVTWSSFLFNVNMALKLKEKPKEDILAVLAAGARWSGAGWNTGKASKVLWELSGVGIVRSQIDHYRDCWLYAVALLCQVEMPQLELPSEVAEAAFSLVGYVEDPHGTQQQAAQPRSYADTDDSEDTDEELSFPWDETTLDLPKPVATLWRRSQEPSQKIEIKNLLES